MTHLPKGLVHESSNLKVYLGVDVAHKGFILFELACYSSEVSDLLVNIVFLHSRPSGEIKNTLGISLSFPIHVYTRGVVLLAAQTSWPMAGTLVLLLAAVVACPTDSTILACNRKVESGDGDFRIRRLVYDSCSAAGVSNVVSVGFEGHRLRWSGW